MDRASSLLPPPARRPETDAGKPEPRLSCLKRGSPIQLFSPAGYEWNRVELPIPGLHPGLDGIRLIHLSDTHFWSRWYRAYDELLGRLLGCGAAAVLFTGDYVESKYDPGPAIPLAERFFSRLTCSVPVYGILGNHDGDLLGCHVPRWGVQLVDRKVARITLASAEAELVGLPGVHREDTDQQFLANLGPPDPDLCRIVLMHCPDTIRKARRLEANLYLTGHTHGGQICFPGGLPLITHDTLSRRMCKGLFRVHGSWLHISRGLGFSGLPIRFLCPGEVTELVLRRF
jgi:predicted MPP superfamily phosphohydrolase